MEGEKMKVVREKNVEQFNTDVYSNGGYLYSQTDKLSCQLANSRLSQAVMSISDFQGKKVLDIGCGDGKYTFELLKGNPVSILGVDAAKTAIEQCEQVAKKKGLTNVTFKTIDIYKLEELGEQFDIAVIRGVLHHLLDAPSAIKSIAKVTDEVIVVEPNGYNPVLKVIEKTSKYHIEHEEKSYFPHRLDQWFNQVGGVVQSSRYCGLVPMFCPDIIAKTLKTVEPIIERTPIINKLSCAVYVQHIKIRG
ncbi:class I SAM-dependent methyltransferase [Paenibacillus silviterrae]|uniref:class I SAM-dependent methyltransferase n=1 Tax=Paenibacillus silviterrae TaxID=3242194 RepID=UPI002543B06B|nr:class I SAM-dependent methyltransferase [Paenibacillus chinjuensis]